jgi:small subunit ribosomal protein S11
MSEQVVSQNTENDSSQVKNSQGEEDHTGVKVKRKIKRAVPQGNAYVLATYNNTLVTITELNGNVIAWSSAGSSNFKGTRKSTPYAAQVAAENAIEKASVYGLEAVNIFIKGVGAGREQAIRGFHGKNIEILSIIDTTPVPHNGCRKKKQRRV